MLKLFAVVGSMLCTSAWAIAPAGPFERQLACENAVQPFSNYAGDLPYAHLLADGKVLAIPANGALGNKYYFYTSAMAYSAVVKEDPAHSYNQPKDEYGSLPGLYSYAELSFPKLGKVKTVMQTREAGKSSFKIFADISEYNGGVTPAKITPKEDLNDNSKKVFDDYMSKRIDGVVGGYREQIVKLHEALGKNEPSPYSPADVQKALEVCAQVPQYAGVVAEELKKLDRYSTDRGEPEKSRTPGTAN
jgi:hypothetical protein